MRIRWVPFALALAATVCALFAAGTLGAVMMPPLRSALAARGVSPMIGAWIALGVGVGTALLLALHGGARNAKTDPNSRPLDGAPGNSPDRSHDRSKAR